MIKLMHNKVWAFDAEWIPDPHAGRLLYDLPDDLSDKEVMEEMWQRNGATEENPTPFLKTVMCRMVSISAVVRDQASNGDVTLKLLSLPRDITNPEEVKESSIITKFLEGIGKTKPQLVGYNSAAADVLILIQRGMVNGLSIPSFCKRPDKPWEGVDYFDSRNSEYSLDLKNYLSSWGKGTPSLNELATLSGIPGKMDVDGNAVAPMWLEGKLKEIVDYNEYDALTTYLVWLRCMHFSGHISSEDYPREQQYVRNLVEDLVANDPTRNHLAKYLVEWDRLEQKIRDFKS